MIKKAVSLVLTLCIMLSLVIAIPQVGVYVKADAAYNYNGGTRNSATFVIDPGHGGSDPGACAYGRIEASLKVAKLIDNSGSSCALTRASDITQSLNEKCNIANSVSGCDYFLSIHRNSGPEDQAWGVETYYWNGLGSDSGAANLARSIHNAVMATGVWNNRYVKTADFCVVRETYMDAALIEVGFVTTASDNTLFDQYIDTTAKGIANGLLAMIGSSVTEPTTVSAPSVSVNEVVNHNESLNVSWGSVSHATSYSYKAVLYQGEPSATSGSTIVNSSTSGTSFTVPGQSSGKYLKITVTANGPSNSASSYKTVLVGPWASYPTTVQNIPITNINGPENVSSSVIWTSSKGKAFPAKFWRAFLCSPNSDGTYTVDYLYEEGQSKSVTASGSNIIFAIHADYTNYEYAKNIVVGDWLSLNGVYLDANKLRGNAHVLVNGGVSLSVTAPVISCPAEIEIGNTGTVSWAAVENATSYNYKVTNSTGATVTEATGVTAKSFQIPAVTEGTALTVTVTAVGPVDSKTATKTITLKVTVPQDITSSTTDITKNNADAAFCGFSTMTTVDAVIGSFEQDPQYLEVHSAAGAKLNSTDLVGTGCTINIVVNTEVKVSYELVVPGDVNGDAVIDAADLATSQLSMKSQTTLTGAYKLASDSNDDGTFSIADIITIKLAVK